MSDSLPRTTEEFQLWMVQKVGEIHTSQAQLAGDVKVAISNHEALKARVDEIEREARTAKYWENGKILAMVFIHGLGNVLGFHI